MVVCRPTDMPGVICEWWCEVKDLGGWSLIVILGAS